MGMYTEFFIKATLKIEYDKFSTIIFDILEYLFNHENTNTINYDKLPDHEFFKCKAWEFIGREGCTIFGRSHSYFDCKSGLIMCVCDLKNYGWEIEKFIDWIRPYCRKEDFICYKWYEEYNSPEFFDYAGTILKKAIIPEEY